MPGIRRAGWLVNGITTYTDGYLVGTNGEPPFTYMLMTASITFGGFSPSYPQGLPGRLIFVQDANGGHDINWNNKLLFAGPASMNLSANAVTVFDVVNTPSGWIATKWS